MNVQDRLLLVAYEARDVVEGLHTEFDLGADPRAYVLALIEALRNGERREPS